MDIRNNCGQHTPVLSSSLQVQHTVAAPASSCNRSYSWFHIRSEIHFADLRFTRILVAVSWSLLILQLGPTLRKFRAPLSKDENELLERYRKILFHRNHYEAVPGIFIFITFMAYLFYLNPGLLEFWLGNDPDIVLLLFLSLLIWDICYRMGLGIWTSILALWRSIKLKKLAEKEVNLNIRHILNLITFESLT